MNIQTLSVIVGGMACNARCPFCVSKMTPRNGLSSTPPAVNWRNFRKACRLAQRRGATTALLTGKGEPTLFPDMITEYLSVLEEFDFPLVDLQTNGIILEDRRQKYGRYLQEWYDKGLTTVAVSAVHYDPEKNREIYVPHRRRYINLPAVIDRLHDVGFSVRLTCPLADGYVDSGSELERLIAFSRERKVEQLTVRPVNRPVIGDDSGCMEWVDVHCLKPEQLSSIEGFLNMEGHKLIDLAHGAVVYDVHGQNVCLSSCLARKTYDRITQLIFFPDGHIRYDWQYEGAVLL